MRRRDWLKLGAAASVCAGAVLALGRQLHGLFRERSSRVLSTFQAGILRELDEKLAGYELDPEAVERFLVDAERFRAYLADQSSRRVDIAGRFLLSTDFFEHGADPKRKARYTSFFHPWVSPCSRFSR
jgi:cation diffusion facilitator CzcD-associated flavoprotein CzcO